jgi:hypothetical protein
MFRITACLIVLVLLGSTARALTPAYPAKSTVEGERLEMFLKQVPELTHDLGDRWPMIMWEGISFDPQPPEVYKKLLARGLTQHVRMDPEMIPTAQALQEAGSPVIMMQGKGGEWPYNLAGKEEAWTHRYEEGYEPESERRGKACLPVLSGWRKAAERVRDILRQYKDAGVTVDAVWMDWEGEPLGSSRGYENARHCTRCRRLVPPKVLVSKKAYREFLDSGRVMNTEVPARQDPGVIWSGLRLKDRAVVRVFRPGGAPATVTFMPWEETEVTVDELAEKDGRFYLLTRKDDGNIEVEPQP